MTKQIEQAIAKIEALDKVTLDPGRGGVFVYDRYGSQIDELNVYELLALAAEVKRPEHLALGQRDTARRFDETHA